MEMTFIEARKKAMILDSPMKLKDILGVPTNYDKNIVFEHKGKNPKSLSAICISTGKGWLDLRRGQKIIVDENGNAKIERKPINE